MTEIQICMNLLVVSLPVLRFSERIEVLHSFFPPCFLYDQGLRSTYGLGASKSYMEDKIRSS